LQRLILELYKRLSDLVLVSNNHDKEFLIRRGFKENKILVTYGGVNFRNIPRGVPRKIYDACFVGRFHAQKGLDDLLNVWSKVCKTIKYAKLVIVGEGDMLEGLIQKTRDLGIEKNVIFTGFLDGKEKYTVMKSSKVFLFPSTYESFGMSALEAMACGLPVVAYDLPVYSEVFSGGMLKVPVGDGDRFYKELIDLLYDKKRRNKLGKEAIKVASGFSWEKTAKDIMERLV
jgi:glycosyltransferase involved in cell wall biosynthesis